MAKTLKYQQLLLQFLEKYAKVKPVNWKDAEQQVIADTLHHHYQLVRMGYQNKVYFHYPLFHFDIVDDKVLVRQNRTDMDIVEALKELGIPKKDVIVYSEFPAMEAHA